jgi:hypothetical protein
LLMADGVRERLRAAAEKPPSATAGGVFFR